ncbi:MAG: 3-phosphoshikimate 1-carboxyvinyltransferase, partial [Actinomycetota bacterium]
MSAQSYSQPWTAPVATSQLGATISLPGSKSLNNRELVLSAVAKEPTTLLDPLESRDSALMIAALKSLGTTIQQIPNGLLIEPNPLRGPAYIDCGLAGTVMRFVPPLASIAESKVSFDGDEAAERRPMKTTIDSLRSLGVEI